MPTREQFSRIMETEFEFPETRRDDDPMKPPTRLEFPKELFLITPEALIEAGWKKMGNAWYGPSNKKLTNADGEWQKWIEGKPIVVTQMNEL